MSPISRYIAEALAAGGITLVAMRVFGFSSYRRAARRSAYGRTIRVAAVVSDGAPPDRELDGLWPLVSPEYADVQATLTRYEGTVSEAADAGARVLVLPEVAVRVDGASRDTWVNAACAWSRRHDVVIVLPYFDEERPINELVILGPSGILARYEKQHPAPLEAKRHERTPPGHAVTDEVSISTVICVDLASISTTGTWFAPSPVAGAFWSSPPMTGPDTTCSTIELPCGPPS